jgi:hypothetical protein
MYLENRSPLAELDGGSLRPDRVAGVVLLAVFGDKPVDLAASSPMSAFGLFSVAAAAAAANI